MFHILRSVKEVEGNLHCHVLDRESLFQALAGRWWTATNSVNAVDLLDVLRCTLNDVQLQPWHGLLALWSYGGSSWCSSRSILLAGCLAKLAGRRSLVEVEVRDAGGLEVVHAGDGPGGWAESAVGGFVDAEVDGHVGDGCDEVGGDGGEAADVEEGGDCAGGFGDGGGAGVGAGVVLGAAAEGDVVWLEALGWGSEWFRSYEKG